MSIKIIETMKRFREDALAMERADNFTTQAMVALEQFRWAAAQKHCTDALALSQSVEQRLCLLCLQGLANGQEESTTKEYLDIAYGIRDKHPAVSNI